MTTKKMGELVSYAVGGGWGSDLPGDDLSEVAIIRGADFPTVELQSLTDVPVRFEDSSKASKRVLKPGDVVLEISGGTSDRPTGRVVRITSALLSSSSVPVIPASFCRLVRPNGDLVRGDWLYYWMKAWYESGASWEYQNRSTGIANFQFSTFLREVDVDVPSLTEQRAIAEVLGALDDKIAANGRVVGIADSLVRSSYAEIQATVIEERPLLAVAENVRQQVQPGLRPHDAYLGLEHLPRRRMWASEWGWAQDVDSAKSSFEAGDVLFGKLRPYFHKVVAAPGSGICSTDILVLRPKAGLEGLVLAAASSDDAVELANGHSGGTRMPRASWASLGELAVPWPGDEKAREFSEWVTRLSDRCLAAVQESHKLVQLRDTLLPELMSGRMRVKDAESTVEEVL